MASNLIRQELSDFQDSFYGALKKRLKIEDRANRIKQFEEIELWYQSSNYAVYSQRFRLPGAIFQLVSTGLEVADSAPADLQSERSNASYSSAQNNNYYFLYNNAPYQI